MVFALSTSLVVNIFNVLCFCSSLVVIRYFYVIVIIIFSLFSLTVTFNIIYFLAHGKKDYFSLHETTVLSCFILWTNIICYNMCAYFAEIYIHSFIQVFF